MLFSIEDTTKTRRDHGLILPAERAVSSGNSLIMKAGGKSDIISNQESCRQKGSILDADHPATGAN
ncbi:hypothetical protein CO661_00040 [Sinorhizobium fredii]|uniref:Uncharacterized protein n=1 Tax=Rhizobium fredii TaxID=380 RepID=A0A2A6M5N1_RHIFR|nr:hypothetical protein CO661_00040 [Sinorhizobium fredii]